ncbi:hypothetical protein KAI32_02990 [Candidatus Pacearchaeota archaeon]|nr:hypothetical protein [Candidatus Pacearchaeota archaeon]
MESDGMNNPYSNLSFEGIVPYLIDGGYKSLKKIGEEDSKLLEIIKLNGFENKVTEFFFNIKNNIPKDEVGYFSLDDVDDCETVTA